MRRAEIRGDDGINQSFLMSRGLRSEVRSDGEESGSINAAVARFRHVPRLRLHKRNEVTMGREKLDANLERIEHSTPKTGNTMFLS
jgi:hypothetical protein